MDPREYELMYQVENQHWWYQGMEVITRSVLNHWLPETSALRILDAGCGTGVAMTTYLADYGTVTGVDLYPQALGFCRKRNAKLLACASVLDLPFASASFDLVTSFDVLYERSVLSDIAAVREFARILIPGGNLLLRLPAYNWLRGQHDRIVHTSRRYTTTLARNLLENSGFFVEHLSYANTFLFPLAMLKRLGEKIFPPKVVKSDLALDMGTFNNMFKFILSCEAPFVSNMGLPYGLSVIAVGRK